MAEPHQLVRRLLETPDIARIVPRLPPELLHRVIDRCGLEAAVEIVMLATPRQLQRLLDIDLWRAPSAGGDEALDAARFGEWVEVLLESGAEATERVADMDLDLVVSGVSAHVGVFDNPKIQGYYMLDGAYVPGRVFAGGQVAEIAGYVLEGRGLPSFDAIVEMLAHLRDARPAFFHRLMRGCVANSDGPKEADGFHEIHLLARDEQRADLAFEREARRDRQGYVAPAQARAFLEAARRMSLDGAQPDRDPVARACLRDIVPEPISGVSGTPASDASAASAVMEILSDEGVLTRPRALIGGGVSDTRLALVHAFAGEHVSAQEELAFLANALGSGCAIQDRPFTPQEASDAVVATCNLGLENWPPGWPARDLIAAFQVGWTVLHRDLGRRAAAALIDELGGLRCSDPDVQWQLQALRRELARHLSDGEPWRARPALDAILMLDPPAWAVLRALLDACPALHASLTAPARALKIDPAAITFVARNSEVAAAHAYLASLAATLTG